MADNLQYSTRPSMKKVVIQEILKMLVLCIVFFGGVILFMSSLRMKITGIIYLITGVMLLIMSVLQVVLTYAKAKKIRYDYYPTRIEIVGSAKPKTIYLTQVEEITTKQNPIDKITGTGSIVLGKQGYLPHIPNPSQVSTYTQKLVDVVKSKSMVQTQQQAAKNA